jgi:hypothetical protein
MEFQEKNKVDICIFDSTGSTTENISGYYSMKGVRRADFIITGKTLCSTGGPSTLAQTYIARVIQATDSSGGGATGISSATAVAGKLTATGIGTAAKAEEAWIKFSTIQADAALTVTINGRAFISATSGSAAYYFAAGASVNATVASEGFKACFNATNNTLSSVWVAVDPHSSSTKAADAVVRIKRKDPDGTAQITIGTTGASVISVGMPVVMHLGVGCDNMGDGAGYVALGVYSTGSINPYSAVLIREYESGPVSKQGLQYSKSLTQSTAK